MLLRRMHVGDIFRSLSKKSFQFKDVGKYYKLVEFRNQGISVILTECDKSGQILNKKEILELKETLDWEIDHGMLQYIPAD